MMNEKLMDRVVHNRKMAIYTYGNWFSGEGREEDCLKFKARGIVEHDRSIIKFESDIDKVSELIKRMEIDCGKEDRIYC